MKKSILKLLPIAWGLIIGFVVYHYLSFEFINRIQTTLTLSRWYVSIPCFGLPALQCYILADEIDSIFSFLLAIVLPVITGILIFICVFMVLLIIASPGLQALLIVICIGVFVVTGYTITVTLG